MSTVRRAGISVSGLVALALVCCGLAVAPSASAVASTVPGPAFQTPKVILNKALTCDADLSRAKKTPVLLVPGTGATPYQDFGWNLALILPRQGYPVCEVTFPNAALGDMQTNVEYVVNAIRTMSAAAGRKVSVIGHSQGAFLISYALRIWPDLASKVDDVIGYAGTYTYGTDLANELCLGGLLPCSPAFQQFRPGSKLLTALAKHPLPAGPSYTAYSSRYDEVVTPQPLASHLVAPGARNYVVQTLCPLDVPDHLFIIVEQPLIQLTLDALAHPGAASLARVGKVSCGLNPLATQAAPPLVGFGVGVTTNYMALLTTKEPALRSYFNVH